MSGNPQEKRVLGMRVSDLDCAFFTKVARGIHRRAELLSFSQKPFDNSTAILTNLELEDLDDTKRLLGLRSYKICFEADGKECTRDVVVKIKATGFEIWQGLNSLAQKIGGTFSSVYEIRYRQLEICNAEKKDLFCVGMEQPVWKALMPDTYHVVNDPDREIVAYAMEDLRSGSYTHLDSVNNVQLWLERDIKDALGGVASFHALYYGRLESVPESLAAVLDPLPNKEFHTFMAEMWTQFTNQAHESFPDLYDDDTIDILRRSIKNIERVCDVLDASPQTLLHNDFNVRNACLRKTAADDKKRLCLYDWEIVRYGAPQHDVAEFLMFVLPEGSGRDAWQPYIEHYREALRAELRQYEVSSDVMSSLEMSRFQAVFDMSVVELLWNRLGSYCMVHRFANLPYIARVVRNATCYLKSLQDKYTFLQD